MTQEVVKTENTKELAQISLGGSPTGGLVPTNFEGIWRLSQIMAKSGLMPKGLEATEKVFVAIQMGLEVGLYPMQAVQNIAVINGRPAIYGDAVLALVYSSGLVESFNESTEGVFPNDDYTAICIAKRKGGSVYRNEFSIADAKRAGLWTGKDNWQKYPKRMLKWRARQNTLRDGFADVLKGIRTVEEVSDYDINLEPTPGGIFEQSSSNEFTPDDFDAQFTDEIEFKKVMEFVDLSANIYKLEPSKIKTEAMKDLNNFMEQFNNWLEKERTKIGTKQDQKQPELPENNDPLDPKYWTNLKQSGFSTFVHKNLELIKQAPLETINNMRDKWGRIYETDVFPLDKDKPKEEPTPQPENNEPSKMEQLFINYTERINSAKNEGEIEIILSDIETDLHTMKLNNVMAERLKDTAENQRKRLKDNW